MAKTTSFVLGLIGGIFGFFFAILGLFIGGLGTAFGASQAGSVVGGSISAILASLVGIIASVIVRSKNKVGGWLMIICAIWGTISISLFYVLPGLLLLLGGILGLTKEKKIK